MRERLVGSRWAVWLVLAWAAVLALVPRAGDAEPSLVTHALDGRRDLGESLPRADASPLRARLAALGISPADADALLLRLSPEERAELAARADELAVGGSVAAGLAVLFVVVMLMVLALELMGRRVISQPS